MAQDSLIEKAIAHILGEKIGFEEAEIYWSLLNKKDLSYLNKNKKYRLFQSLFKSGFLFKIKTEGLFEYIPIPPTFLYFGYNLSEKIIKKEEKRYIKNYSALFNQQKIFIETSAEIIDSLILFLINYFMEKEAYLVIGGPPVYSILKEKVSEKFDKINFVGIKSYFKDIGRGSSNLILQPEELISDRRFCIIDQKLLICLFKTLDNLYVGYITSDINKIKEKNKEFIFMQGF